MITEMQLWDGKCQVEEFKMSASYKELLVIDGETIEFECEHSSRGFRHCSFFRKSRMICENGTLNLRQFTYRIIFMSNVQRHRLDKKTKRWNLYLEFRKSQGIREEILAGTLDVPRSWRRKRSGKEENGTLLPLKWWHDSKIPVIQYSRVSVL